MEKANISQYWCHACSRMVGPIIEIETVKCPNCQGGFLEQMSPLPPPPGGNANEDDDDYYSHHRALSLWAPILLGIINTTPQSHYPSRPQGQEVERAGREEDNSELDQLPPGFGSIIPLRRRNSGSAPFLRLMQGIRAGMRSEEDDDDDGEGVILINPLSQTILDLQAGSSDDVESNHINPFSSSLGDYFLGAGLDMLLQHLADNHINRYGTPPAQKDAVEALPTVNIQHQQQDSSSSPLQCSVCLEDFEIGSEAKQMPCHHCFHSGCIIPWLQLHSSCPVCRYQLPSEDDSKLQPPFIGDNAAAAAAGTRRNESGRRELGGRFSLPIPWPVSHFFNHNDNNTSQSGDGNSSSSQQEPSSQ
ncbi:OLC1v1007753C1 [Oldenlandia corymbosa var. corymbosa]|uniref:RING-type E3 ubiquitin transferase n=1 Tax=Oldenlandia corymbosa var. corymbosa TaxID=529605 RepID=A0AAV1DJW7_OLDCO|nr:OLC1v1007753C1 [Oldenlandia corymbosa var. corymbosa]